MDILKATLRNPKNPVTIADAAAASGLSFQESERGLLALVAEYRGEIIPTEKGELLFRFPTGFSKPWEKIEAFDALWQKLKKGILGVAKFVVRAWITIVMVAYVVIFAAILIALAFAQKSDRDDRGHSLGQMVMLDVLFRTILDSLFWTFHPWSPYSVRVRRQAGMPFYERVNRFFFGPEEVPEDPLKNKRLVIEAIRAGKGRIGLLDVLRVTGMSREQADPFIAKLMLDYNGDIQVSEHGAITYSFPDLRRSAESVRVESQKQSWMNSKALAPFTGNPSGSNILIAGLNGFNLFMSMVAIENHWTLEGLKMIFAGVKPELIAQTGAPLLLGWIPFWFSVVLFALPLIRWVRRSAQEHALKIDNGRRGVLWAVLNRLTGKGIAEPVLVDAWEKNSGSKPSVGELAREVVKLGGDLDVDMNTGQTTYRFKTLELEVRALEQERSKASQTEVEIGKQIEI